MSLERAHTLSNSLGSPSKNQIEIALRAREFLRDVECRQTDLNNQANLVSVIKTTRQEIFKYINYDEQ